MNVDAVDFLPAQSMPSMTATDEVAAVPEPGFANWFSSQLGSLNGDLMEAQQGVQSLAAGADTNLHQVMMKLEQAKLSMQLMLQVRNHLLDAYQEIIRMPI